MPDRNKIRRNAGAYDDIIGLPHHVSPVRPQMPRSRRAVQFLPFAALSGYGDMIREVCRHTDEEPAPCDGLLEELNLKAGELVRRMHEHPEIRVTHFVPDPLKDGGSFEVTEGRVERVDAFRRLIVMEDGSEIGFDSIIDLDGEIFSGM